MADGMPQVGEVVAAKYRIDRLLGKGGMGAVFAATHTLTGKRLALKVMLPEMLGEAELVERFIREARASARIDSAHVVDVYDVGQEGGTLFMVMELLQGEALSALLERGGVPRNEVLQLLLGAMRGVAAAHAVGVVHRDLKPDNIFIVRREEVAPQAKVLDFGISKLGGVDGLTAAPRLTRTGAALGTPYYMAPEQVSGLKDVDARADIYAFGVILFEIITGRVPFDANNFPSLMLKIVSGEPPSPRSLNPEVPQRLEAIVAKAMSRDREARYQRMQELIAAVEQYLLGMEATSPSLSPRAPGSPVATPMMAERDSSPPRPGWGLLLVIVGSAALCAGAFALWSSLSSRPAPVAAPEHDSAPGEPNLPGRAAGALSNAEVAVSGVVPAGSDAGLAEGPLQEVAQPLREPDTAHKTPAGKSAAPARPRGPSRREPSPPGAGADEAAAAVQTPQLELRPASPTPVQAPYPAPGAPDPDVRHRAGKMELSDF